MARVSLAHVPVLEEILGNRRYIAASVAGHVVIVVLACLLPSFGPPRESFLRVVAPVVDGTGGAGAAGTPAATSLSEPATAAAAAPPTDPEPVEKAVAAIVAEATPEPPAPPPAAPLPAPPIMRPEKTLAPPRAPVRRATQAPAVAAAPAPATTEHFLPMPLRLARPAPEQTADEQIVALPQDAGAPESWTTTPAPEAEAARGTGVSGTGLAALGTGRGPGDDYFERLRRYLATYKRYPPDALRRKQEGTVTVRFEVAHNGTVLGAVIERSSGFPLLDQAVLEMLNRASPVPALPDSAPDRGEIVLPIAFKLGVFDRLF